MTVIAVRKYENKIVMAADSQTTWGDNNKTLGYTKIVQQNTLTAGCAGNALDASLFEMFIRTHLPKGATKDDIIDFLSEFVDWKNKKTGNPKYVGQIILVIDDVIFNIFEYAIYSVVTEFSAIGSGMFAALGAMELGVDPKKAAEIAIKYDAYCGGEVQCVEIPLKNKSKKNAIK